MRDYIYKRDTPPKRRTSLTWGRPVLKLESWTLTTKLFLKLTLHLPSNSIRRALENTALQLEGTVQCDSYWPGWEWDWGDIVSNCTEYETVLGTLLLSLAVPKLPRKLLVQNLCPRQFHDAIWHNLDPDWSELVWDNGWLDFRWARIWHCPRRFCTAKWHHHQLAQWERARARGRSNINAQSLFILSAF